MKKNSVGGFTLIELLAGMAILTIMVLFLGKMFSDSVAIWKLGNKRIENNTDGRAAVDFMLRELSSMICDTTLTCRLYSNVTNVLQADSDAFYFVAQNPEPQEEQREAMEVGYFVTQMIDVHSNKISGRYRVLRAETERATAVTYQCYTNQQWCGYFRTNATGNSILAENVRSLEFWVYDSNDVVRFNYDSSVHGPPSKVDVYLELLGEDDAVKASYMTTPAVQQDFVERLSKPYVGRAYLSNRKGYVLVR